MRVTFKTREELFAEGYTYAKTGNYIKKGADNEQLFISHHDVQRFAGKVHTIVCMKDRDGIVTYNVFRKNHKLKEVSKWLIKTDISKLIPMKTQELVLTERQEKGTAKFFGKHAGFDFSCGLSTMNVAEARKLAQWVLKVTK